MERARTLGTTLTAGLVGAALAAACGGRGPLDTTVVVVVAEAGAPPAATVDAGTELPGPDAAAPDAAAPDAAVAQDAARDARADARPIDSGFGPIVDCPVCVGQACGEELRTCLSAPSCQRTLQCAFTQCLNGGFDTSCVLACANGDVAALAQLFAAFQCITRACGPECASVFGR